LMRVITSARTLPMPPVRALESRQRRGQPGEQQCEFPAHPPSRPVSDRAPCQQEEIHSCCSCPRRAKHGACHPANPAPGDGPAGRCPERHQDLSRPPGQPAERPGAAAHPSALPPDSTGQRRAHSPLHDGRLDGKSVSPFVATSLQHLLAVCRAHPLPEAMRCLPFAPVWLVGPLHDSSWKGTEQWIIFPEPILCQALSCISPLIHRIVCQSKPLLSLRDQQIPGRLGRAAGPLLRQTRPLPVTDLHTFRPSIRT
jgi:hypothetical protein